MNTTTSRRPHQADFTARLRHQPSSQTGILCLDATTFAQGFAWTRKWGFMGATRATHRTNVHRTGRAHSPVSTCPVEHLHCPGCPQLTPECFLSSESLCPDCCAITDQELSAHGY